MTSNPEHGGCPEKHGEKLKFVRRMEGSIQMHM
jgi:hypothetical protein